MLCILGTKYAVKTHQTPTAVCKPSQLTACPSETTDDSIPPTAPARPTQDLMSQGQVGGSESDVILTHSDEAAVFGLYLQCWETSFLQ